MSTYENRIDEIRRYFEEHKAERYPFENIFLREKDEYIKSLYLRMLCVLIRYTNEPSEMQILYIRRIIQGIYAEQKFEDYIKMAMDIDTKDVEEFIAILKEDYLKYYFCIDGIILLNAAKTLEKHFELLAEIIELLGVTKEELKYFTAVAKAVLAQSSTMFDEAKTLAIDSVKNVPLYHYISNFYAGTIVNTDEELHFYSHDKSLVDISVYGKCHAKRVIIENVTILLQKDLEFEGCSEILIKNCNFEGNENKLLFSRVGKLIVENCKVHDFSQRFMIIKEVNYLTVRNNYFINCGCIQKGEEGGIIFLSSHDTKEILLMENELQNCYLRNNYMGKGVFLYDDKKDCTRKLIEEKNQFNGCFTKDKDKSVNSCMIYSNSSIITEQENSMSGTLGFLFY